MRRLHILFARHILNVVAVGFISGHKGPVLLLRVGAGSGMQQVSFFVDIRVGIAIPIDGIGFSLHREYISSIGPSCTAGKRHKGG